LNTAHRQFDGSEKKIILQVNLSKL